MRARYLILACAALLIACQPKPDDTTAVRPAQGEAAMQSTDMGAELPAILPIKRQFACLPEDAAFIAAHRGTSKKAGLPENSASSLRTIMDHGTLFAEIDVAGLKDGTLILFHDGVWDEKSTGKGAVAAATWDEAEKILLLDTDGEFSSDRPVRFADVLRLTKDRLYLEIDFKSSANYESVIDAINIAGMADQVILISYTDAQAAKLARLAPDMLISVSVQAGIDEPAIKASGVPVSQLAAWLGKPPYNERLIEYLRSKNVPVLSWPPRDMMEMAAGPATLMVTDYALKNPPIYGLTQQGRAQYDACLSQE